MWTRNSAGDVFWLESLLPLSTYAIISRKAIKRKAIEASHCDVSVAVGGSNEPMPVEVILRGVVNQSDDFASSIDCDESGANRDRRFRGGQASS